MKRMFRRSALFSIVFGVLFTGTVSASEFENCILKHMPGTSSDEAAKAIRDACRNLHSRWESYGHINYSSEATKDNHNVRARGSDCKIHSPDGKYCADVVKISAKLSDDEQYEYRFIKFTERCPKISVGSGLGSHFQILSCSLSENRKWFEASIKGWTRPQVFKANLETERRKK